MEASGKIKNKRKILDALTKKLLTVALVAQIGNNADIVAANGGPEAFVKVITTLSGFKDTEARRRCLDAAINGLGLLTKKVPPKSYLAAVRMVVSLLMLKSEIVSLFLFLSLSLFLSLYSPTSTYTHTHSPTHTQVPVVLESFCDTKNPNALLCISRFAASPELQDMILKNDKVLNTLLEILRDDDGTADPTIAALIMKTFASLAQKDDAARDRLAKLGILEEVMDWIQQSGEEAQVESVGRAFQVLGAMSLSTKHAKTIHKARVFDQCVDLMTDRKLNPVSFAAGMNLVTNVMKSDDKVAKKMNESGVVGRLVNMFVIDNDDADGDEGYVLRSAYVHDDDTAEAAVNFIFTTAQDKDLKGMFIFLSISMCVSFHHSIRTHTNKQPNIRLTQDAKSGSCGHVHHERESRE